MPTTLNIQKLWDQRYRDESVPFPLDSDQTAVTQDPNDNSDNIATTAYADSAVLVETNARTAALAAIGTPISPVTPHALLAVNNGATAWQEQALSASAPIADGVAAAGTSNAPARGDHVHPAALSDQMSSNTSLTGGFAAAGQLFTEGAFTPDFYPLHPEGRRAFSLNSVCVRVKTVLAASTVGVAIYSITYTGSKTFSATLVAANSSAIDGATTGIQGSDVTSAPITLDFTANQYIVGVMASSATTLQVAGAGAPSSSTFGRAGMVKWNAAARSSATDWPASFTQSSVSAATGTTVAFWALLITPAGKNWF